MIRAEVRHDGDSRADVQSIQIGQLETAQFQHDDIVRSDLIDARQQADADVSAKPTASPRAFSPDVMTEDRMRQRRRGGLPVAPGDRDDRCAVPLPEQIHLTRQRHTRRAGDLQTSVVAPDAGIDHDQFGATKVLVVVPSQFELDRRKIAFTERGSQFR